jgi:hypothetical protein
MPGQLSNHDLISHLEGRYWVGTHAAVDHTTRHRISNHFVIDLDARRSDSVWDRYDQLVEALGLPSLLFRSSTSGGLHAYYFLTAWVPLWRLMNPTRDDGLVERLLTAGGLHIAPGSVEVYPQSTYRGNVPSGNVLRLPFGKGSALLDPADRDELACDAIGGLKILYREACSMRRLDVEALAEDVAHLPAVRRRGSRTRHPARDKSRSHGELWTTKLTGFGQRFHAVRDRCHDLAMRGVPYEEGERRLIAWLDTCHNGYSHTYNRNPEKARQLARKALQRRYATFQERDAWRATPPGVTDREVGEIIERFSSDYSLADPDTGEIRCDRFKVQSYAFKIVAGMKQWVVTELAKAVEAIIRRHPHVSPGSTEFDELLRAETRWFWPDHRQPFFHAASPFFYRETLGFGETQYALWRVIRKDGWLPETRSASEWAHRCALYGVTLDFGDCPRCSPATLDLAARLKTLLTVEDRRRLYSRYYRDQIVKAAVNDAGPPSPMTAEAFARFLLANTSARAGSGCIEHYHDCAA